MRRTLLRSSEGGPRAGALAIGGNFGSIGERMTKEGRSVSSVDRSDASGTLRARVSRQLRDMIIAGQFRPGERLLQQQLARRFGVSQSVMREALLEAQFSGLVASADGAGACVAEINIGQLMKAYEVREMLEGLAARICCHQTGVAHVRELEKMARSVHALGVDGQDRERAKLDREFHERIIALSNNEVVQRLSQGYHVVRLAVLKVVPHDQILQDHLAIVEAIRAGEEAAAEQAARRHVVSAREMIRRQLETSDVAFPWDAAARAPQR